VKKISDLDAAQRERLARCYASGATLREAADRFGVSRESVRQFLMEHSPGVIRPKFDVRPGALSRELPSRATQS
jgi:transposase